MHPTSAIPSIPSLKKQADALVRAKGSDRAPGDRARALDHLANHYGFSNWSGLLRAKEQAAKEKAGEWQCVDCQSMFRSGQFEAHTEVSNQRLCICTRCHEATMLNAPESGLAPVSSPLAPQQLLASKTGIRRCVAGFLPTRWTRPRQCPTGKFSRWPPPPASSG